MLCGEQLIFLNIQCSVRRSWYLPLNGSLPPILPQTEAKVSGLSRRKTRSMDAFDLEIQTEFINEALINLEEAESSFMELESTSDPKPLLEKIFRLAHNLKGGARAVGFGDVAEFTHQLENLVSKIQKGGVALSPNVVTVLLRSNDRLVEMLSELKGNLKASFNNADLLKEIQAYLDGQVVEEVKPATVVEPTPIPEPDVLPTEAPPTVPEASAFFEAAPAAPVAPEPSPSKPAANTKGSDDEVVRVNLSRIDNLNDYVGELIVLQSVIQQQAQSEKPSFQALMRQMVKLSKDIQGISMSLRMLPVKPLVQKLQRVVRDTARTLGKDVIFEVDGDSIDVDKTVLDRLADPLIHVLRNAVDHGLEMPDDRERAGKARSGRVRLSISNEGNNLVVEARDDGKGINPEIVRAKAIEKGVIPATANLTDKQLIHLVFHPGFSTKSEASEISGRGVGMDVVKTNIERVGGQVEVTSEVGKGSVFRMQIPLSLAVIEGLVVCSATHRYVIPLSQVQETINLKSQRIHADKVGVGTCFDLRGAVVPLVNIDEAVGSRKEPINSDDTGLIINIRQQPVALVVKDILRSQQIVIKPLGNGVKAQKGWIGSCILGDGLPTLILSPTDLLEDRITGGAA